MTSLLTRVRAKLFIRSSLTSMHALDGAYASAARGRSNDFEDLREYEHGDEVRDIDWRATARLRTPMIKRMRATRMHTVLFVVDTGRSMAALAAGDEPKRDLAVMTVGVLGMLALRHDDDFSVVMGDAERVRRLPPRRSEGALEQALRAIDGAATPRSPASARERLLDHVARTISRRMIVVVVTDEAPVGPDTERLLRRLRAQHDLLWVTLRDALPVLPTAQAPGAARRDVDSGWEVPGFLHGDEAVVREVIEQRTAERAHRDALLSALEISHAEIGAREQAVPELLRMLRRRAHAGV
ncbi:DUF58 domain-containing protein [Microbacterium marinilacus]|uniref:DUF58 domain-containing protein n=1 Tax=Microbacterium marinilacus TaxID=415209 RepID=A0ABP7BTG4_9MICO|nr:DUF58 domain-containing protein [Microbacterium marinilacus]MBY0688250.1 DUF58 domain-containing protein [Microbacterium marinilacus]